MAIAAEKVLVAAEMAAAVAVAATMATVAMVATTRQPCSGDGGANMAPTVAEGAADGRCGRRSTLVFLLFG